MTNKMRDAINSVMANYNLSESDVLRLLAAGANCKYAAAIIDFDEETALDWFEFMEGGDC